MADFINPIGAYFRIKQDAPLWVKHRLKGLGGMCTIHLWKAISCRTENGELVLTFKNCYGLNESIPSKYMEYIKH